MLISTRDAFEKRHITREDGIEVLPRQMITVAALEAGYCLSSPTIGEAVSKTTYPGQMTAYEFTEFCEDNKSSLMSAEDMAKCVVVVAPAHVITRRSLEEIMAKGSSKKDALSDEEVDALFSTLDTENKGAITDKDFMRALYGDLGVRCLAARRKLDALEAKPANPVVYFDITAEGDALGRVSVELFRDVVPRTSENFRSLCTGERGYGQCLLYYKGTPFHRIIPGFVMQGGDILTKDGRSNVSVFGYPFPDESFEGKAGKHLPGTVGMAHSGPNQNGSQFFFNLGRNEQLDRKFVVVGQVLGGWEIVNQVVKLCGSRCGTPVSRAWISDCGQSGGYMAEETQEALQGERAQHVMPGKEVLDLIQPRY
ncbi:Cyclophilin type peptidyl-prolyl cis-trans isomerase/CLD family protein [Leishmania donovani]|uniref:peptidylprolyl isomerase n=1 Tax=Leishmania donovani TaxID=5661 RepID=A0A504Y1Q2_LEIDO|nr:Cyclophilin type peptidyl-prolyl cis-trans isomerase/CLD family protein [Leishmania donovani]